MPSYSAAHKRLGQASAHTCSCGQPARDWAMITGEHTDEKGRRYSIDPANYVPMCRQCHMAMDLRREFCGRGHATPGGPRRRHGCPECQHERSAVIGDAHRALGITFRQYVETFGRSRITAEFVLTELRHGVRPADLLEAAPALRVRATLAEVAQ